MPHRNLSAALCAAFFLWGCAATAPIQAQSPAVKTHEFRLDNGLKLIVKEDHRAPVVVTQVWYKVGSSYEHDGVTGLSHLLEHMMFKGTTNLPPGEFSRIISENGGRENAFTGRDYTAYFQTLEKSRLPISFQWEADRMRNLVLKEEELVKELKVVQEERRLRTDDNPEALLYERFNATAHLQSPLRIPIIGWMNDLQSVELTDLKEWYQKWYAPNNATVVVVGDVDPQEVHQLALQHFGPLKAEDVRLPKPRLEVPQQGERRMNVKLPAKVPYFLMGYKIPVLNSVDSDQEWEAYALDMLAGVLDGGSSARLSRELVRTQKVAQSVGAGYDLHARLPGLFLFEGTPAQGRTTAELEQAIEVEIEKLQTELVTIGELDRIRAQVVASKVYERDSVFYQAMQVGMLETIGLGYERLDEYLERLKQVTPEQVRLVAQKYLIVDRRTVAHLDPQPMKAKKRRARGPKSRHL